EVGHNHLAVPIHREPRQSIARTVQQAVGGRRAGMIERRAPLHGPLHELMEGQSVGHRRGAMRHRPIQLSALGDGGKTPLGVDRCLMTSYINRAAAVATLRELTRPNMGRRTHTAAASSQARLKPCFSGPTAIATGPRKSVWL